MNELQRHLQAQREAAMRLIHSHNQMLAVAMTTGCAQAGAPMTVPYPPQISDALDKVADETLVSEVATSKVAASGKVIPLFDYKTDHKKSARKKSARNEQQLEQDSVTDASAKNIIFKEEDESALAVWGEVIDKLLAEFGGDDALAIHRKILAGSIFLNSTRDAFFFHACANGVIMALCYVGAEDRYDDTLTELIEHADDNDLVLNVMAQENRVEALTAHGMSTTPVGIWQRIEPLADFTLAGSKMRRLRYIVNKYKKLGDVKLVEYVPGTTTEVDQEICDVMDEWVEIKQADPPFVPRLKKQIMAGTVSPNHLFFLTYRDDRIDNVIILSVDNLNDGYLMDAEFYVKDMPLGSTEFAICEMIERFTEKDKKVLSLGLTLGTGLFEHENRSQEVHDLYAVLKKTEFVNGDANAQYKNKYRPDCVSVYMARPLDSGSKKLNDLMIMLGQG